MIFYGNKCCFYIIKNHTYQLFGKIKRKSNLGYDYRIIKKAIAIKKQYIYGIVKTENKEKLCMLLCLIVVGIKSTNRPCAKSF